MSWAEAFENINYLSVALGAIASLVLGAFWYSPKVLGKKWAVQVGLKKKDMESKDGLAVMMITSVIFYSLVSLFTAALMQMTGAEGIGEGLLMGLILGFVFGFGPLLVTYSFARRMFDISLIDGGYIVVTTLAIGTIIGAIG